jgi:hypothetical protein
MLGGIAVSSSVVLAGRQAARTAPKNARAGSGRLATVGEACADTVIAICAAAFRASHPSGGRGSRPKRRPPMTAATQRRSDNQRLVALAPTIRQGLVLRRTSRSGSRPTPNNASAHATALSV